MEYTTLGNTGMTVSRLCLGCMSFSLDTSTKYDWAIGEDESEEIIERAIDLGLTFFDTSNSYSWGDSERVLGRTLDGYDLDEFVVGTKVFYDPMDDAHPHASGLSRKTIEQELNHSLDRLGMDTVDLYQIHRWDYNTPISETLRALNDAVRRNKVRYIGASSMLAYQLATSLHMSEKLGLDRFATMQNHYNLVYREGEREQLPLCEQEDLGVIPWSPLARGYLTRPHEELEATIRGQNDIHPEYYSGGGQKINARVKELATEKDISMAQVALAWVLHKDWVDAPIIGTTSIEHLEDAVAALDVSLTKSEITYLEEPYEPVPLVGPR